MQAFGNHPQVILQTWTLWIEEKTEDERGKIQDVTDLHAFIKPPSLMQHSV